MNITRVLIVGTGGHGKTTMDAIEASNCIRVLGFIDRFKQRGASVRVYSVLGAEEDIPSIINAHGVDGIVLAVGDNEGREIVFNRINGILPGFAYPPIIHPSAIVSPHASVGEGSVILAGAHVGIDAVVGRFCILNTNASVDHDSRVGDFSSLAPGVCLGGRVHIKERTAICIGATIANDIHIGSGSVVGAGSVVLKDIEDGVLAYGSPARQIRERKRGEPYL